MCEPAAFSLPQSSRFAAPCPQGGDEIAAVDDIALQHLRRFSNWLNSMQKLPYAYFVGIVPMRVRRPTMLPVRKSPSFLYPNGRSAEGACGGGAMRAEPLLTATPADAVLNALPHPVIVVSADGKVADANVAAEAFFEVSMPLLRRHSLRDLVPFGSPLLTLVEQVRDPRRGGQRIQGRSRHAAQSGRRLVDLHVAPLSERPDYVVVMLQERTIADKMDRQLTHRGAARSVIALASMLAHEIKNPLSGIRGAAQLSSSPSRTTTAC